MSTSKSLIKILVIRFRLAVGWLTAVPGVFVTSLNDEKLYDSPRDRMGKKRQGCDSAHVVCRNYVRRAFHSGQHIAGYVLSMFISRKHLPESGS